MTATASRRLVPRWVLAVCALTALALGASLRPLVQPAQAVSTDVVISQVYGGGGAPGATFAHDFVELFNRGSAPVSLEGWSIQYASATGTGNFGANDAQLTPLGGTIEPGHYLLVQEASDGSAGAALPQADRVDDTPINLGTTGGKVALARRSASLECNGGSTPCPAGALADIVDLVGYGDAGFFESVAAPAPSNITSIRRINSCQDSDNNSADFAAGVPTPRTAAEAAVSCSAPTSTVTPTPTPTATPAESSTPTTTGTPGPSATPTATQTASPTGTASVTATAGTPPPAGSVRIHDIQGAGHISPYNGAAVSDVPGIVTAKQANGFYFQDPAPDGDDRTAEGVFVFTDQAPAVTVGDDVRVSGAVREFRPGCTPSCGTGQSAYDNLTRTEINAQSNTPAIVSGGNALPAPVVIGASGRVPPTTIIEDDASGNVETSGVFDPAADGVDFYESLEGMRVQVNDAVAVGPSNPFGEIPVVPDNGGSAAIRTGRGGIVVRPDDFNPERIIVDDGFLSTPDVNVGDQFPGTTIGVMDYDFGNFRIQATTLPAAVSGGLAQETTAGAAANQVSIATFNVQNLDANDAASKFATLARLIVTNLASPDIVALEEIQDNNGPANDTVVDASQTYGLLIDAIKGAGGPTYQFRQIDPVDDQDGGETGGNIRVGFLFRTDRGLAFVDRPGGGPTTGTSVVGGASGPELSASPGRIDPTNPAFASSRKPLAGEFVFNGQKLFVVANHFTSKVGDDPLFGRFQPPGRPTEAIRVQQAQAVNTFVDSILAVDANANVVVLGDLNDFQFSTTLATLSGGVLYDLVDTLPESERYTYVYQGNSEALDHILVSGHLRNSTGFDYDVVHVNAEFFTQASDHDPQVVRLALGPGSPASPTPTGTPGTATPTPTPIPTATPGGTSGATTLNANVILDGPSGGAIVQYNLRRDNANGAITGNFQYIYNGVILQSTNFTALAISGNHASFDGTCTNSVRPGQYGTGCTFHVDLVDNGPAVIGGSDTISVTVSDGPNLSGSPRVGDIKIPS
jgi:predicted extracellular nuclease